MALHLKAREVSSIIAFIGRLGDVADIGDLVRSFVLQHLAVGSAHLPGVLQLLQLALSGAAALRV